MIGKKTEILMTEGPIWKNIVNFSIPLMIGYFFQMLYTTVDSMVVGKVEGKEALAAIGVTTPIINTMLCFFVGLSIGAGVIVSNYFGAQNAEKVKKAVNSFIFLIMILNVFATFIGIVSLPTMMRLMSIPGDVWDDAYDYLFIFYCGISALILYNCGSAILRAVGDSRRPLLYLVISSVVNVILDVLFVVYFKMGIRGAAYATVISEIVSVTLVLYSLTITKGMYRLEWKHISIDWPVIKEMMFIGIPNALQQSLTCFSNVFVQSYINFFGSSVMAGWSAYLKIDSIVAIPIDSITMALTTFVGQNLGAGKLERSKKGTWIAFIMVLVSSIAAVFVIECIPNFLVGLFNSEKSVIESGALIVRTLTPFYLFFAVSMVFEGSLVGAGAARTTTILKFSSYVVFRQIYLFIIRRMNNSLIPVIIGYPLGWMMCSVLISIYYFKNNNRIISKFLKE